MKSIRILPLLLALVLLCTGCAAGGAAEPTPAPDMSDLPLDGGYAYLRVEVLSRDKDAKTLEVKVLDFGDADGVNVGALPVGAQGTVDCSDLLSMAMMIDSGEWIICAAAAMIPSFGCVLQFISPFVFERMHHRKLAIWLMCVVFRLSISSILLVPLALPDPGHARAVVLVLYTIGFFSAGLVTPGLEHMVLGIAPQGGRGQFYAVKSIIGTCVSSAATLALGRVLDYYLEQGQGYTGFLIIGIVSLSLTVVDAVLLASVRENPVKFTSKMRPADILRPVRDPAYRPLLFYCIIGGLTGGFASPFLSVYELRVLGLSHTFITSVGVVSAVVGMAGSWVWGRLADRTAWNCVIWLTAFLNLSCTLGWSFVRPSFAHLVAPVLIVVAAGCAGGASLASTNLQFALSPESGKTAYFGVTAAMSSIATCTSAAVGTAIQPMLEKSMGDSSISLLFFVAGIGGFANLIINGRKLPSVT